MRKFKAALTVLLVGTVTLTVAACGSSSSGSNGSSSAGSAAVKLPLKAGEDAMAESISAGTRGGTLTVLSSEGFQHLDPGSAYFALDYAEVDATQRPLFIFMPNSQTELAPDLATEIPSTSNGGITDGGRTITIHIQPGVKYAPPVNRVVTSADVAYAIERMANPNVGNAYWSSYFQDTIVGAKTAKGGPISGLSTPNATTLVIHLNTTVANTIVQALSLPGSSPVPASVATPLDKHAPTNFGVTALTATGPYMIQGEQNGNNIESGYTPGKSLTLVRNPNWNPNSYAGPYKPPAYLNQINLSLGGNPSVIGPQVLKGSDMVEFDTPTHATVEEGYEHYPSQITFTTGSGDHYVSLDNQAAPFNNVNLRRAVYANLDRAAIVKEKGGALAGEVATHFIYPGTEGFAQAGGYAGPNYPWATHPTGDLSVAKQYMKAGGYPSGQYTGGKTITIVASNNGSDELGINQIVKQDLSQLGFKVNLAQVDQSVMYTKCEDPKNDIDVCPSGGWLRDFNDPFSIMWPTLSTAAVTPTVTENFGQVESPQLDSMMQAAYKSTDPTTAAELWGKADNYAVDQAFSVPEDFDNQPSVFSSDVHWVGDVWDEGEVNFSYTSLK